MSAPRRPILVAWSIAHPRLTLALVGILTVLALLPLPGVVIDTDPENMLPADEPVRLAHHEIIESFALHDVLVVGMVHDDGMFTPERLSRVQVLTDSLLQMNGVMAHDIIAPSEVDDISQDLAGGIRVQALMPSPPGDLAGALAIHGRILANPLLAGKLASEDGTALALYVPLEDKDVAEEVGERLREIHIELGGDEELHLAGLPVAEDSFGAAMFEQMAIAAPIAFFLIFLLILWFFRKPKLVLAPMALAMVTVFWTMGLLAALGFPLHIMSSMIPVFLSPVSVLDSVHVLSSIHDHYRPGERPGEGMKPALDRTFSELWLPMGFTSLTTLVGFGALLATPIPPVQVFGMMVAFGVAVAWFLSMTMLPAWAILLPESALAEFGQAHERGGAPGNHLQFLGKFATGRRGPILALTVIALAVSVWGISRIVVNDNPVNWFKKGHPIRLADDALRDRLAGGYLAYLDLDAGEGNQFVDPIQMAWLDRLEAHMRAVPNVGGASSVADIARKVLVELRDDPGVTTLPDDRETLAQLLFLYEMGGGDPEDLYHFITPDQQRALLWLQLKRGENADVSAVQAAVDAFAIADPPPAGMEMRWAGLSTINVVWQKKMVAGMAKALLGSFAVVLLMMVLLFRSLRLGLIALIPLSTTIALTYAWVGLSGRDYDMPIAVLSSLALGLSIDFAIHLIERWRELARANGGDFEQTRREFFGHPAQALARNIVVIALGFVPMFFSPLTPYVTVGAYFVAIMLISGATTFLILPALLSYLPKNVILGRGSAAEIETQGVSS